MNFITKFSLVANLGLATFAWWEYKTAYQSAENWLKHQVEKSQAEAQASCDQVRSCSSLWKIAFDLAANPQLPKSDEDEEEDSLGISALSSSIESISSSAEMSETGHEESAAKEHGTSATGEETADAEHEAKGEHTDSTKAHTPLPRWAQDLERRIKNEEIWGSEIELETDEIAQNRATLKSGSCELGVTFQNGFFRADPSRLRKE